MSIDREINFMIKYKLTSDELFLIKLIFYAQNNHPEYLSNYFQTCSLGKSIIEILQNLQDKGLILKSYKIPNKGSIFKPEDVIFNKIILKTFMQYSNELGMELFENYPSSTVINGRIFSLRNITKLYKSLDDMSWDYGSKIKFNPDIHFEIMELLEYGKDNNLITNGICDFISSEQWKLLKELKDNGLDTFDNSEAL